MPKRFPIEQIPLRDRCSQEGLPWGGVNTYSATPAAGATSLLLPLDAQTPPMGQVAYIRKYRLWVSRACNFRLQWLPGGAGVGVNSPYTPASNSWSGEDPKYSLAAAGQVEVDVEHIPAAWTLPAVRLEDEAGSLALTMRATISGWRVADDQRWDAAKVIAFVGDSIQSTGPTVKQSLAWWQVRDYLRTLGKDYRAIVKQQGGITSTYMETWRKGGLLDMPEVDVLVYQIGANDGGTGVSSATYQANWAAFVAWALYRWPLCKIIMCGPTPAENNTTETALATYRTNLSAYVSGLASSRVKYLNLGNAFDRTVSSNYISSDTPGSRIHPSDAGNTAVYTNDWKPFIDANSNWF